MVVRECLLEAVQLTVGREPLDRLDLGSVGLDRQHHAALHEHAVDEDGAGSAVPRVATDVTAGQVEIVADEVDQQPPRIDLALVLLAVDVDGDRLTGGSFQLVSLPVMLPSFWVASTKPEAGAKASLAMPTIRGRAGSAGAADSYCREGHYFCPAACATARRARTSARWRRYSAEACTSQGGSRFAACTALRTAPSSLESGLRRTGTASTQPI